MLTQQSIKFNLKTFLKNNKSMGFEILSILYGK